MNRASEEVYDYTVRNRLLLRVVVLIVAGVSYRAGAEEPARCSPWPSTAAAPGECQDALQAPSLRRGSFAEQLRFGVFGVRWTTVGQHGIMGGSQDHAATNREDLTNGNLDNTQGFTAGWLSQGFWGGGFRALVELSYFKEEFNRSQEDIHELFPTASLMCEADMWGWLFLRPRAGVGVVRFDDDLIRPIYAVGAEIGIPAGGGGNEILISLQKIYPGTFNGGSAMLGTLGLATRVGGGAAAPGRLTLEVMATFLFPGAFGDGQRLGSGGIANEISLLVGNEHRFGLRCGSFSLESRDPSFYWLSAENYRSLDISSLGLFYATDLLSSPASGFAWDVRLGFQVFDFLDDPTFFPPKEGPHGLSTAFLVETGAVLRITQNAELRLVFGDNVFPGMSELDSKGNALSLDFLKVGAALSCRL
jgi:hypothetical protein